MSKRKTLFMQTTKIDPEKTVTEIQRILGENGANAVLCEYEHGEIAAVSFKVNVNGKDIPFRLPCRSDAIKTLMNTRDDLQPKRVAWRQILRWIEAQMALVQTKMVKVEEVFLPYMQVGINQTLYQKISVSNFKMLEDKSRQPGS